MRMCEHYMALEEELNKSEAILREVDSKIETYLAKAEEAEAEMKKWQAEAEKVEAENERLKKNVLKLREAISALQECDFAPTEEELKKDKQEQAKKEALANAKEFNPAKSWTRKKGDIGKFKQNGELIDYYTSQRSAAIALRWDASSICRFMKMDHETQVRKKGFYLEYMGK